MSELWHPRAKRIPLDSAGAFTGGGWKLCWHTTEGSSIEGLPALFRRNGDAPHFALQVSRWGRRTLHQYVPLNRASSSLQHPAGTAETNHANVIQVELVGFSRDVRNWSPIHYLWIRRLARWIEKHADVPREAHHPFVGQHGYHRLSEPGWVHTRGHVGHCHCPNNDHTDPGNFPIERVI